MKKIIAVLFLAMVFNCNSQTQISSQYDKIGNFYYGIAVVKKNGFEGAINTEGKEVIKPEWDRLSGFGKDGIGFAHKNGLVGLIDKTGKLIAKPEYSRIGNFKNGKAVVVQNGKEGIMNIEGKIIVAIKYDKLKVVEGGAIRATENGQEILITEDK